MNTYVWHKLLSIFTVGLLLLVSYSFSSVSQAGQWFILLLTLTIFGYSHFVIGAVYQLRSYHRQPAARRYYIYFTLLCLGSLAITYLFTSRGEIAILSFAVLGYFMIHGFFNEITLFERQTEQTANRVTIAALSSGLLGLIFLGVGHASWFFTPALEFISLSEEALTRYLTADPLPLIAQIAGLVFLVLATVSAWYVRVTSRQHQLLNTIFAVFWTIALPLAWYYYPLHYLLLLTGLLVYHFMVWFIFFLHQFYVHSPDRLYSYLGLHVVVAAPFLLIFTDTQLGSWVDTYLLNSYTFLTMTFIHISISFMNESWFKSIFMRA